MIESESLMPVLFVGHGSPMNAIENNEFAANWENLAAQIPRPKAILCISAHWVSRGTFAATTSRPETIYDFYGFPEELYNMDYPAPGAPDIAQRIQEIAKTKPIYPDESRGLDHGAWIVLTRMYPKADIPALQLSLDNSLNPLEHYNLGKELLQLRREGILIVGSGNIVHNLTLARMNHVGYPWAYEFDEEIASRMDADDHYPLIHYELMPNSGKAFWTNEHYLPLLYVLALKQPHEHISHSAAKVIYGSISMRCVLVQE
ncbi:MAG: 4,5-DOPA-extradiol-dioxygenase [Candidatus Thorarchaeota archaeon]|jgi:4,5-DOPA dioxygenase extradiol